MFAFVLLCITLCHSSFENSNHLEEEDKPGCFAVIVLQMYCYYKCSVAFPHVAVVGRQCVIVVFPDHTHSFLHMCYKYQNLINCLFIFVVIAHINIKMLNKIK